MAGKGSCFFIPLEVVANYEISDSVVNWRLLFDIVSWELVEVPLRLGTKING